MEAAHTARINNFNTFTAAECGIVKFIRDIVDKLWYKDLKSIDTFYMHVTGLTSYVTLKPTAVDYTLRSLSFSHKTCWDSMQ